MRLEEIIGKREQGYAWGLSGRKALLRKNGHHIIGRKIDNKFLEICLLGSIDAFCFGIFGPNGRDRIKYQMFLKIVS